MIDKIEKSCGSWEEAEKYINENKGNYKNYAINPSGSWYVAVLWGKMHSPDTIPLHE